MKHRRLFITGTDTNIGKTVLSLMIMQYYFKKGATPFYLKPFQTGCTGTDPGDSDAGFIYQNIEQLKEQNCKASMIYCLKEPKAPLFAARNENVEIDIDHITEVLEKKCTGHNPVIIEGAGGLLVPVTRDTLMVDIIPKLNAKTILAANAGLGTINHTLLSIEALKSRGVNNPAVVMIKQKTGIVSDSMLSENIEAIEHFSGIRPSVIGYTENFSSIDQKSYTVIDSLLT